MKLNIEQSDCDAVAWEQRRDIPNAIIPVLPQAGTKSVENDGRMRPFSNNYLRVGALVLWFLGGISLAFGLSDIFGVHGLFISLGLYLMLSALPLEIEWYRTKKSEYETQKRLLDHDG